MHSLQRLVVAGTMVLAFLVVSVASAETWVDSTGKFRVDAKFLGVGEGNVYLQMKDGKRRAVPLRSLSPESLALAKRLFAASKNAGSPLESAKVAPASSTALPTSSGKSKLGANPTARETAEIVGAAMAEFDMVTIWDAFPSKNQDDIEQIIRLAASSIDEQTWSGTARLIKNVSKLANDKKDLFLNNPMIGGMIGNTPEINKLWDAAAGMLDAYANSMISDQSAMRNFSMERFIAEDVPKLRAASQDLTRLTEDLQDSPFAKMAEVPTIETISESSSEAVYKITMGEKTTEQTFVKAGNRWVPVEMVEGWDEGIQEARDELTKLSTPEGKQAMAKFRMVLVMASTPVDQLLGASGQTEFDAVIESLSGMVMGMMGGMGGPGGPGFGAPGGPGALPPGF